MRKWILKILCPLWLFFLLDMVLYFGLNSSVGPRLIMSMVFGRDTSNAYKIDAVRVSPFLQHFCVRNVECSDTDGQALKAGSLCGKLNIPGIMAFRGGVYMDSLKADGLSVHLDRPKAVYKCFGSIGKNRSLKGGLKTQVDALSILNGILGFEWHGGSALLSHLIITGNFSTKPLLIHGQVAGKYTLNKIPMLEKLFGNTGKFMIGMLNYKGVTLSMSDLSIGDRLSGRFSGTLPLGKGPMNMEIFHLRIPELTANGGKFNGLQIRGISGNISGVRGRLNLDYFSARSMDISNTKIRIKDLWGSIKMSATLLTGLDLEELTIRSHQINARLSGSSESAIDASVLKLNIVVWNADGVFLLQNGLYPQAETDHMYSGVGTVLVRLRPFKLESSQIHWVNQWSYIF